MRPIIAAIYARRSTDYYGVADEQKSVVRRSNTGAPYLDGQPINLQSC